eukprot:2690581-Alexandrium_andersonii.AAC.1
MLPVLGSTTRSCAVTSSDLLQPCVLPVRQAWKLYERAVQQNTCELVLHDFLWLGHIARDVGAA